MLIYLLREAWAASIFAIRRFESAQDLSAAGLLLRGKIILQRSDAQALRFEQAFKMLA